MLLMPREKKTTVPVRLRVPLVSDAGLVAHALGESTPEYIERVVAEAIARDMPRVVEIAKERMSARRAR